jgi:hypothetical protein
MASGGELLAEVRQRTRSNGLFMSTRKLLSPLKHSDQTIFRSFPGRFTPIGFRANPPIDQGGTRNPLREARGILRGEGAVNPKDFMDSPDKSHRQWAEFPSLYPTIMERKFATAYKEPTAYEEPCAF